jgi:hypothetical protein
MAEKSKADKTETFADAQDHLSTVMASVLEKLSKSQIEAVADNLGYLCARPGWEFLEPLKQAVGESRGGKGAHTNS